MKKSVSEYMKILEEWFLSKEKTITAFSGGIDSSLVLYLSKHFLGKNALGCISKSASLKSSELDLAIDFCRKYDISLEVITTSEMEDENYLSNPSNRCYFCKNHLYLSVSALQKSYPNYVVLNGSNLDDLGDYRPGLLAASEHNVSSPLVECHIDKNAVREISKYLGIEHWDKPASPCLSSRVPYGRSINSKLLKEIENGEALLNQYGFTDVRVRHFEEEARIEVPTDEVPRLNDMFPLISNEFEKLGFPKCVVDQEGLVSGKLNRVLSES
ncbi:MAG: ATP-dependent sacrificial sulfur transferase LarE [Reichenbachiella sp.]